MKTYIYKFADGTESAVEVSDELYALLEKMDDRADLDNRRERRRHISMEYLVEKSVEPTVTEEYFADGLLENLEDESLYEGIAALLPTQQELLKRRFVIGMTVKDIAEQDGIKSCSVSKKFERIYRKLYFFTQDRQLLPSAVAISVGVKN